VCVCARAQLTRHLSLKFARVLALVDRLAPGKQRLRCQSLYLCTSKAIERSLSTCSLSCQRSICTFVLVKQVN
jgi:hypothetical protein